MRSVKFRQPVEVMTGRVNKKDKNSQIFRQKFYRDENGNIIGEAHAEHYIPRHPRNYKSKPMTAAERKTVSAFQQAAAQYKIEKTDPVRMDYWKARFKAQLRKPDAEAPFDPKTGKRHVYARLDMFIRAMLQIQFRAQ